jgi:hypothetical protein
MANVYTIGQQVRLTATFKTAAGTALDPTGVVLKYRDPVTGTVATKTYGVDGALVKDSTGVYHFDITLSTAGEWWYSWTGSGSLVAADEERILVEGTRMV